MNSSVVIFDPVPYTGGSKKVINQIFSRCPDNINVYVISNDKTSWQQNRYKVLPLFNFPFLMRQTSGGGYLLKQLYFSVVILFYLCQIGKVSRAVGISGPTVDLALYLVKLFINWEVIQLIQGNIPSSYFAGYGLKQAFVVYYLKSTEHSIELALNKINSKLTIDSDKFSSFVNAVNAADISVKKENSSVGIFWAASLLPWKKMDDFVNSVDALSSMGSEINTAYFASVCYINPNPSRVFNPKPKKSITFYHEPNNLDEIRANASIFVSTAKKEPFGLSILESMIAGLAVVIPRDNAYWDQQLTHGVNCVKFDPESNDSLTEALFNLINDENTRINIAKSGQKIAQNYTSHNCYSQILKSITN